MRFWTVVVPVKRLAAAKTRLDRPDRAAIALALATDTVAAVAACPSVAEVVVVTDDAEAAAAVAGLARVVADEPDRGLNPALAHGAEAAVRARPGTAVAVLAADLPALRPDELTAALVAAEDAPVALVADAAGDGTVLLAVAPDRRLEPRFGSGSRAAHLALGALDLTDRLGATVAGLRRDVDTLTDLDEAAALGLGAATRALLDRPPPVQASVQATVQHWDGSTGSGSVVDDRGERLGLPAGTRLADLRSLRPGQRVQVIRTGQDVVVGLVGGTDRSSGAGRMPEVSRDGTGGDDSHERPAG